MSIDIDVQILLILSDNAQFEKGPFTFCTDAQHFGDSDKTISIAYPSLLTAFGLAKIDTFSERHCNIKTIRLT